LQYAFTIDAGTVPATQATLAPQASCSVTVRFTNLLAPRRRDPDRHDHVHRQWGGERRWQRVSKAPCRDLPRPDRCRTEVEELLARKALASSFF